MSFGLSYIIFSFVVTFALANLCPSGYTQAANGGDCFQAKLFLDSFVMQYYPKTYDEAEIECNKDGGGLLAAIHSDEENQVVKHLKCEQTYFNIGLKCKGQDCKWDDGSPMTYSNFKLAPNDDDTTRCYSAGDNGTWQERGCGKQQHDCWICRVKAKTIDCLVGETEYKGGCVSVHSAPLDQKSAEVSCPGGGHLVSIHSSKENDRYKQIALDAGISGAIYIGGQFTKGVFTWTDGSYYGSSNWANGFPNILLGSCAQMLLASEFGVQGQWTNIDCNTRQPYMCFRDGAEYGPPLTPPTPLAEAVCPSSQNFTGNGTIYSPNFPLSIPGQQVCEYIITPNGNCNVAIRFPFYDCRSGTQLTLIDTMSGKAISTYTSTPPNPSMWQAAMGKMKLEFTTHDSSGTGWMAEFQCF